MEANQQFEKRKVDHIKLSLDSRNEAVGGSQLDTIGLLHEALPDLNFEDINLETEILGLKQPTPFLVSSMTAGHADSVNLNLLLASVCEKRGWLMGVGSQRRELTDDAAAGEWRKIRAAHPRVKLLGNLGLSQLIQSSTKDILKLTEALEATAMIVHLNPLQECLQPEGTPQFKGGLKRLSELVKELPIPVVVKETGCGFSKRTLERLNETGVAAVDVSGFGGTHWGRIEGGRLDAMDPRAHVAKTFENWGVSTAQTLIWAEEVSPKYEIWASGGIRSGLDAAKVMAMGAGVAGFAKPVLAAALNGAQALDHMMQVIEQELKTALFCTGCASIEDLKEKKPWRWMR